LRRGVQEGDCHFLLGDYASRRFTAPLFARADAPPMWHAFGILGRTKRSVRRWPSTLASLWWGRNQTPGRN